MKLVIDLEYRKATFDDIEPIFDLINGYATDGMMLARSRNTLYESIRDMIVAVDDDGSLIGVGSLHMIWDSLAEVRSMAVAPHMTRRGIGQEIVKRLIEDGKTFGVKKFFTLTYKPKFFEKLGFIVIQKEQLSQKVWKECIDCPKFPNCDEIAMVLPDETLNQRFFDGVSEKISNIAAGKI